jgi:hypothetical protein
MPQVRSASGRRSTFPQPRRIFPQRPRPIRGGAGVQEVARTQSNSGTPANLVSLNRSEWQCAGDGVALPCRTDPARTNAGPHQGNVASSPWHSSRGFLTTRGDGPVVLVCLPHRMGTAGRQRRCLGTAVRGAKFKSEYAGSRPGPAGWFPSFRQRRVEYARRVQQVQKTPSLPGERNESTVWFGNCR